MLDDRQQELPPRGYTFGMWLFLAALGMLFAASMVGYTLIRLRLANPPVDSQIVPVPRGQLHPPMLLMLSTALILCSSLTIHAAVSALKRDLLDKFRKGLAATLVLASGFVAVQVPAMIMLLGRHHELSKESNYLFGFAFALILLHALHVLGGLIPLVVIHAKARRRAYDAQHDGPPRSLAYYWHFLDAVWLIMFSMFLLLM
ncbi:MAG: heme-copper oxidase subunit III [Phycisphaeraceae bacterium]|nr:heme-copper oxidase subunit III [Phycisphaeraceae bacterium]